MQKNQKDQVRPVSADGIQEFDNQLPTWWVGLFYLTVVIGIGYGLYKYMFNGESLIEAYDSEISAQMTTKVAQEKSVSSDPAEQASEVPLAERVKDPAMIAAGKVTFQAYCVPCHGSDGGGVIGPNLTDHNFLHGHTPEDVVRVISDGVLDKGMANWKPVLGQAKVEETAAYVLSLLGTTPLAPKAPQGENIP